MTGSASTLTFRTVLLLAAEEDSCRVGGREGEASAQRIPGWGEAVGSARGAHVPTGITQ